MKKLRAHSMSATCHMTSSFPSIIIHKIRAARDGRPFVLGLGIQFLGEAVGEF